MRLETWIIGAILVVLTLSAFVGLYLEQADADHYNVDSPLFTSNFSAYAIQNHTGASSTEEMENYTILLVEMTNETQNAPVVETDFGTDMTKSQTNVLKKAWNFFSDTGARFIAIKGFINTFADILHIPSIIIWAVFGIIVTMLIFAFLNAIFGRNL